MLTLAATCNNAIRKGVKVCEHTKSSSVLLSSREIFYAPKGSKGVYLLLLYARICVRIRTLSRYPIFSPPCSFPKDYVRRLFHHERLNNNNITMCLHSSIISADPRYRLFLIFAFGCSADRHVTRRYPEIAALHVIRPTRQQIHVEKKNKNENINDRPSFNKIMMYRRWVSCGG